MSQYISIYPICFYISVHISIYFGMFLHSSIFSNISIYLSTLLGISINSHMSLNNLIYLFMFLYISVPFHNIYIYIYIQIKLSSTLQDPQGRCHKGGPGLWRPLYMPPTLTRRGPKIASNPSEGPIVLLNQISCICIHTKKLTLYF